MKFERYYIYVILFLALVMNWIVTGSSNSFGKPDLNLGLLPKKSIIIIELFQVLLLSYLLLYYKKYKFVINVTFLAALFVAFEFVIHYVMGNSITVWISGIRYYLSFLPIFLLGYVLGAKGYKIDREFKWLLALILLQVPITIWQFFKAQTLFAGTGLLFFDTISGTMGGFASNLMSIITSIGALYFFIKYLEEKKIHNLFFVFILIIPSILSEAKGMFIILIFMSAYIFKIYIRNLKKILKVGFIITIIMAGFVVFYNFLEFDGGKTLGASYLIDYVQMESGSGRLSRTESVIYASELIIDKQSPLFGMGIGSANNNPLGSNPVYNNFFTIRHSIDTLITETGLFGIVLLIAYIFYFFRLSQKIIKKIPTTDKFNKNMARLLGGLMIILSISLFWTDVLYRVQFMYPFGLLAGYIKGLSNNYR